MATRPIASPQHKVNVIRGQQTIEQLNHHDRAGAQTTTPAILAPGAVFEAAEITSAVNDGVAVVKSSIIRMKVTADTYVAFYADTTEDPAFVPSATTQKTLLLDASLNGGWHMIRATAPMMRLSAAPARIENLGQ